MKNSITFLLFFIASTLFYVGVLTVIEKMNLIIELLSK